jgi:hypothetical protein
MQTRIFVLSLFVTGAAVGTVGCTSMPSSEMPDLGSSNDAGVIPAQDGGALPVDSGRDGGVSLADVGEDAPAPTDASAASDAIADAYVAPMPDAGSPRGTVVRLGVGGNTNCVLTSTHQMWCWGQTIATPTYVMDAQYLEGTCGIALDGHAFCPGGAIPGGTDVVLVGSGGYVLRSNGTFVVPSTPQMSWAPPSPITELPASDCALLSDGTARCWDTHNASFMNFMNLGPATDVARAGNAYDNTYVGCTVVPSPPVPTQSLQCFTTQGTTGSAMLNRGTEVDIAGGRACAIITTAWSGPDDFGASGYHNGGIYCTSDMPSIPGSGYNIFNPISASDPVGAYTRTDTSSTCAGGAGPCTSSATQLRVGLAHACFIQAGHVMCWGDGSHAQLGGAATTRTPVTVF